MRRDDPSRDPASLDELISSVERAHDPPLARLGEAIGRAHSLSQMADLLVDHFVQAARAAGHTWAEIGSVLGVSKQAAQQRFAEGRGRAAAVAAVLEGMTHAAARHLAEFGGAVFGVAGLERFTEEARRAVMNARDVAKGLGHTVVGTEHLLLGVVTGRKGPSTRAFSALGVSPGALERKLRRARGEGKHPIPEGTHVPFSERAKTVLTLAMREALQMGENRIEPHHVLLAVLRHGEGQAVGMLDEMGIDLHDLRAAVMMELQRPRAGDEPGGGAADDQPR